MQARTGGKVVLEVGISFVYGSFFKRVTAGLLMDSNDALQLQCRNGKVVSGSASFRSSALPEVSQALLPHSTFTTRRPVFVP